MYNFISTFNELNKLYEEVDVKKVEQDDLVEESCAEELVEAADDDVIEDDFADEEGISAEEAPIEEPAVEDEPRQVICECDKCGALVIKDEADIVVDEDTDLVNVEDECQFCEEAKGFKIIGVVAPYEAVNEDGTVEAEPIAEALNLSPELEKEISSLIGLYAEKLEVSSSSDNPNVPAGQVLISTFVRPEAAKVAHKEMIDILTKAGYKVVADFDAGFNPLIKEYMSFINITK